MTRIISLITILALTFFNLSWAAEPQLQVSVNSKWATLDTALRLSVTIKNAQNDPEVKLPNIDGFDVQYEGPSTQVTIVNGNYSKGITHRYALYPKEIGTFTIPSVSVTIDGKTHTSEPIDIEISNTASNNSLNTTTQEGVSQPTSLKDRLFLKIAAPKNDVYLYEKIPIKILMYVNKLAVQDIQYPTFEGNGFSVSGFSQSNQYSQTIDGVLYDILEIDANIYPTRTGQLTIGPASIQANLVVRNPNARSPFEGYEGFFDNNFFDTLVNRAELRPVTVQSQPLNLNILPLPAEGQSANFSQGVGKLDFSMTTTPGEINEGDPITVKMRVSGEGYLPAVEMPAFKENEDFKVYDPQVKEENNEKILEQILIPKSSDVKEVPRVEFQYFDPQLKSYQTISKGPSVLKINPSISNNGTERVVTAAPQSTPSPIPLPQVQGQDINFIKPDMGRLLPWGKFFIFTMGAKGLLLLITLILVGLGIFFYRRNQIHSNQALFRRLRAPKKAKLGISEALSLCAHNKIKECYDVLFKTVQEYLSDKLHLPTFNLSFSEIKEVLRSKSVPDSKIEHLKTLWDHCDQVRFASHLPPAQALMDDIKGAEDIIDYCERNLK